MNVKRKAIVKDIDSLLHTIDEVVGVLHDDKRKLKKAQQEVTDGSDVAAILTTMRAAEIRQRAAELLQALDSARHQVRVSTFAAGLDEGMTIGDLGRAWGFSRQLASRYAKEAQSEV